MEIREGIRFKTDDEIHILSFKDELLEYPYKVGDWVYFLGTNNVYRSSFWTIGKTQQITKIHGDTLYFNDTSSSNKIDQFRPCFKHEIPTNTNQVIVENMDYLIPFIDKLNEKRI